MFRVTRKGMVTGTYASPRRGMVEIEARNALLSDRERKAERWHFEGFENSDFDFPTAPTEDVLDFLIENLHLSEEDAARVLT